jgi:hypothetical protein
MQVTWNVDSSPHETFLDLLFRLCFTGRTAPGLPPPTEAEAIKILFGIKDCYEKFHAVGYTDESIETAVYASSRYIPDR